MWVRLFCLMLIGTALLAGTSAASVGQASEAERIARNYLDAYAAVDTKAMERFLDPEAIFSDRTARPAEGGPIHLVGRDVFLRQLKAYGLMRLVYKLADVFESNGCVVFIGRVEAYYPHDSGQMRFSSRIVTVITVRDGKVTDHEDLADYTNAEKLLVRQGGYR